MTDSEWVVGFHAVLAVLEANRPVELLWLQDGRRDGRLAKIESIARDRGLPLRRVPKRRLDEVAPGHPHNGCALRSAPVELGTIDGLVRPDGDPASVVLLPVRRRLPWAEPRPGRRRVISSVCRW